MGSTFRISSINKDKLNKLMTPLVFCISEDKMLYTKEYNVLTQVWRKYFPVLDVARV